MVLFLTLKLSPPGLPGLMSISTKKAFVQFFFGFRPWQAGEARQKALEKSLGIKDQSCPMLQLSCKVTW